jgi:hypothetical protein
MITELLIAASALVCGWIGGTYTGYYARQEEDDPDSEPDETDTASEAELDNLHWPACSRRADKTWSCVPGCPVFKHRLRRAGLKR